MVEGGAASDDLPRHTGPVTAYEHTKRGTRRRSTRSANWYSTRSPASARSAKCTARPSPSSSRTRRTTRARSVWPPWRIRVQPIARLLHGGQPRPICRHRPSREALPHAREDSGKETHIKYTTYAIDRWRNRMVPLTLVDAPDPIFRLRVGPTRGCRGVSACRSRHPHGRVDQRL
jgi:hypothetical protein